MISEKLHKAVSNVCPIYGVSIGKQDDRSTWKFHPMEESNTDQIKAAQMVIETFTYSPPTIDDEANEAFDVSPKDKTILKQLFLIRKQQNPALTLAQFRAELISDYKGFK